MKVIEVNKNLFKDKLSIYLSKDREFWARKEKAGFSESLNLFELSQHSKVYKIMCSGDVLSDFQDKDILYAAFFEIPGTGVFQNLIVIEE